MLNNLKISSRVVGPGQPPFIIAEMSGNHNQSLDYALKIVDAAARCGVDAIKLQTYTADTITLDVDSDEFIIKDEKSLWAGKNLYQLYQEAHTPWEWHAAIFERARQHGLIIFSTPFDETAVDFLEELDAPCYKIASFENNHYPLIKRVAKTGKPMIISLGMASLDDIEEIVAVTRDAGCNDFVLLKCTSAYPADCSDANVATVQDIQQRFNCLAGLSDHTLGIGAALSSIAFGASVIEKHFTLARADGGVDSKFSLEPHEMAMLVEESHRAWASIGQVKYGATANEQSSFIFKRSIYVSKDIKQGEKITADNIKIIRPAHGLEPKYIDQVIGQVANSDIKRGTALKWEYIS